LQALHDHLGVEQFDLLGFSHGGCVAMAYAAAHPQCVHRLLLVDTLAGWDDDAEAAMARLTETRKNEPWYAEAQRALGDEQAVVFSSVDELIANLQRQIPLYFPRWEGTDNAGTR